MGQAMSFGLTQYDVEELVAYVGGKFSQEEIESLYMRFRALDRGRKGFITSEEFLTIPELSINPLAKRLAFFFESINFKEFLGLLSAFSPKATRAEKLRLMFIVFDVDGDGVVSEEDMELMLRQMAGSSLTSEELRSIVRRTFDAAGAGKQGLTLEQYKAALKDVPIDLRVHVPVDN